MYRRVVNAAKNILKARAEKREFKNNRELAELYKIFQKSPEGRWILGQKEILRLFKLIKQCRPKNMLELGLGIGASAAAMALASDGDSKVTSMEQYEKCVRIAQELIPQNLQKKIKMVYSPIYAFKNDAVSPYLYFSGYQNLPVSDGPFDFVLVDGPGAWEEGGKLVKLPNGDLINLLPHLTPGCKILIDGRKSAVEIYQRFLSKYLNTIEETKNYTILERTAKPLQNLSELEIEDRNLASRIKKGYFD